MLESQIETKAGYCTCAEVAQYQYRPCPVKWQRYIGLRCQMALGSDPSTTNPKLCSSLLCISVNSPNSSTPQDICICCFHCLECSFSVLRGWLLLIPWVLAVMSSRQKDHALHCPPQLNKSCHSGFSCFSTFITHPMEINIFL